MKQFLKWTAIVGGLGLATVYTVRAAQGGRRKLKSALGEAEAVASQTRATVEQAERALHDAHNAL